MPEARKRPCRICRRWFRPDSRGGVRQRACHAPECQTARRQKTQASWRSRNPGYTIAWRIDRRATQVPQPPEPLRLPAPLDQLPWEFAKDQFGVQRAAFIGVMGALDPNPEKILIEDVAQALAHQCRFGGHASKFYSVAEHSVHVSHLCLPEHALWGLLHDASEAYLVDLPRPLKLLPEFAAYREAERRLQRAVAVRFGLAPEQPASVTAADDTMLWIEAHSLLGSMPVEVIRDTRPPFEITDPLLPVEAERLFLSRFNELTA